MSMILKHFEALINWSSFQVDGQDVGMRAMD